MAWLPSSMRNFLRNNENKVKEAENSRDEREPTPAVQRGIKFTSFTHSNKKYNKRETDGHLFDEDLSHYNSNPAKCSPHYEVYKNLRDLEKGKRDRSVTWDGRPMKPSKK